MVCSKIIHKLPVSGNVEYEEDKINDPLTQLYSTLDQMNAADNQNLLDRNLNAASGEELMA